MAILIVLILDVLFSSLQGYGLVIQSRQPFVMKGFSSFKGSEKVSKKVGGKRESVTFHGVK